MKNQITIIGDTEITQCFFENGDLWRQYSLKNYLLFGMFIWCKNRYKSKKVKSYIDDIKTLKNDVNNGLHIKFDY